MPVFAIVVLALALIAVVAMLVVRNRTAGSSPRRGSKQRAKREGAEARDNTWPAVTSPVSVDVGDDAPRMPMGDLPPRPSRRRH